MKNVVELNSMKVAQLLVIAKDLNIKGRHDMRKDALVKAIANSLEQLPAVSQIPEKESKASYIENAKIGTIVAFRINDRKTLSGKIEEIHREGFVVETKNGARFNVRRSNIVWVKTGARWPRGVYLALKGDQFCERKTAN